jgi:hypothetical protein
MAPATPPTVPSDRCPRCEAAFGCGIATGACWCADVVLTPERQAQLAAEYAGCLCPACLRELSSQPPPGRPPLL